MTKPYACLNCSEVFDVDHAEVSGGDTCADPECRSCGTEWPELWKCECGGDAVPAAGFERALQDRSELRKELMR